MIDELRFDFLKHRLDLCFKEAIEIDLPESHPGYDFDHWKFPPMLFLVNHFWEIVGGPVDDSKAKMDDLVYGIMYQLQALKDQVGAIEPYVMAATSGMVINDNSFTPARLFTVRSLHETWSRMEYQDGSESLECESFIDEDLDETLHALCIAINELKELNNDSNG